MATVITDPAKILHIARFTRLTALKLEAKGMKRSRGPSARSVCIKELQGTGMQISDRAPIKKVVAWYEAYVEGMRPKPKLFIEIDREEDPPNCRKEWDNAGTMVCWHGRYNLGDEHEYKEPRDFLEAVAREVDPEHPNLREDSDDDIAMLTNENLLEIIERHGVILPLGLYDHGGITMKVGSFGDRWDSGQVGWIYILDAKIKEEWDGDKAKAEACLESEVKTYDMFLTGDVWRFTIEDEYGDHVDSLGDIYDEDYLLDAILDHANLDGREFEFRGEQARAMSLTANDLAAKMAERKANKAK